jgi:methyltransferase (TIGR00027 family)
LPVPITDPISLTSRLTAAARARESLRPDRLFSDPLASALAGSEGVAFMERLEGASRPPGAVASTENPYIAIRTRFFDEFFGRAAKESEARQVVLLAAGLDTRAFRLDWPEGTRLFELDRPEVVAAKQEVLEREAARPKCDRRVLGVDLDGAWPADLVDAGFDPQLLSLWLIEGLTPYLDEGTAGKLIGHSAALAAPGSRLGVDMIGRTFLESPYTQATLALMTRALAVRNGSARRVPCGPRLARLRVAPGRRRRESRSLAVPAFPAQYARRPQHVPHHRASFVTVNLPRR